MIIYTDDTRYFFYGQGEETFLRYELDGKEYTVRVSTVDANTLDHIVYFLLHDEMKTKDGTIPKGGCLYLEYDRITNEDAHA